MAEGKDIQYGLVAGVPTGKVIELYPKGHGSSIKKEQKGKTRLTKKGVAAVALATGVAVGAVGETTLHPVEKGIGVVKEFLGQTNEIKTYSKPNIESLNEFEKQVESQLEVGKQVKIADLTIAVPEGSPTLKIRYYAKTLPVNDISPTGGIAVEITPGHFIEVQNAAVVYGETVDPNDPFSNRWFAVNLRQFGLEGYGYISNSSFTQSSITPQIQETVTISKKGENGALYFSENAKQLEIGKVIENR